MKKLVIILIVMFLFSSGGFINGGNECIPTKTLHKIAFRRDKCPYSCSRYFLCAYDDYIFCKVFHSNPNKVDDSLYIECRRLSNLELLWEYEIDVNTKDVYTSSGALYVNEVFLDTLGVEYYTKYFYNCFSIKIETGELIWQKKNYRCLGANEISQIFHNYRYNTIEYVVEENILWKIKKRANTSVYNIEETKGGLFLLFGATDKTKSDGDLVSVDTSNGEFKWKKEIPFDLELSLGNGFMCYYKNSTIDCINTETSDNLWSVENIDTDEIITYKNYLYSISYDNGITCLNSANGNIVWELDCQSPFQEDSYGMIYDTYSFLNVSIVDDRMFIIPSPYEKLYTINLISGDTLECYKTKEVPPISMYGKYYFSGDKIIHNSNSISSDGDYMISGIEILSITSLALKFTIDQKSYIFDGEEKLMDVAPIIQNGRTILPARYVCEPLGGQVFWDGEQRKVTCKLVAPDNAETEEYKENVVELWIGKSTAKVNGVEVQIDPNNPEVVPTIINDRTMVPMRFLAESLGCEVEWIAESKEIILTYSP